MSMKEICGDVAKFIAEHPVLVSCSLASLGGILLMKKLVKGRPLACDKWRDRYDFIIGKCVGQCPLIFGFKPDNYAQFYYSALFLQLQFVAYCSGSRICRLCAS